MSVFWVLLPPQPQSRKCPSVSSTGGFEKTCDDYPASVKLRVAAGMANAHIPVHDRASKDVEVEPRADPGQEAGSDCAVLKTSGAARRTSRPGDPVFARTPAPSPIVFPESHSSLVQRRRLQPETTGDRDRRREDGVGRRRRVAGK